MSAPNTRVLLVDLSTPVRRLISGEDVPADFVFRDAFHLSARQQTQARQLRTVHFRDCPEGDFRAAADIEAGV